MEPIPFCFLQPTSLINYPSAVAACMQKPCKVKPTLQKTLLTSVCSQSLLQQTWPPTHRLQHSLQVLQERKLLGLAATLAKQPLRDTQVHTHIWSEGRQTGAHTVVKRGVTREHTLSERGQGLHEGGGVGFGIRVAPWNLSCHDLRTGQKGVDGVRQTKAGRCVDCAQRKVACSSPRCTHNGGIVRGADLVEGRHAKLAGAAYFQCCRGLSSGRKG